jgi:predicted nucleotidyltransferase
MSFECLIIICHDAGLLFWKPLEKGSMIEFAHSPCYYSMYPPCTRTQKQTFDHLMCSKIPNLHSHVLARPQSKDPLKTHMFELACISHLYLHIRPPLSKNSQNTAWRCHGVSKTLKMLTMFWSSLSQKCLQQLRWLRSTHVHSQVRVLFVTGWARGHMTRLPA